MDERLDGDIAFIGAGNMARALIRGLVDAGRVAPGRIRASDPVAGQREYCATHYGIDVATSNTEAARDAAVVVLAVKPQHLQRVLDELRDVLAEAATVISIVAGATLASIEARLRPGARVVRAMPNVGALVGEGATALVAGSHATVTQVGHAITLFDAVGLTVQVEESLMDAVTGLSGSGPAYVFLIIEALADAGVKMGLSRALAQRLAAQTLRGAAQLVLTTGEHPAALKDSVCSPGGTTIAAIHALERGGLRAALIDAVEAAVRRARELSATHR